MKSGGSICIVDDDEDDRMLMRAALEEIVDNVHVVELRSGYDLIHLLDEQEPHLLPHLILMDMNMPGMNGLETLNAVRASPDRAHVPILMVSTSANQQLTSKAYEQGINAYVAKPSSFSDYTAIAEAINVCFLRNKPSFVEIDKQVRIIRKQSILVIEDNPDHWELMKMSLNQSMPGANLIHMTDTNSTLQWMDSGWPGNLYPLKMILLELYLPTAQHGLDLLGSIKAFLVRNGFFRVPIIIFTRSNEDIDARNSYQHQANIYMVKPNNMAETEAYFQNLCLFL